MRSQYLRPDRAIPVAVLGGALLLSALPAAEKDASKHVRVGLVNTLFREDTEKQIQSVSGPFKSLMEEQAGVVAEVFVSGDAEGLASQLKEGKVHLGAFNGFEFAWARQKNADLKPLMVAVNQQPFVRAVLVVRQEDKVPDPTALKGKVLALPQLAREHSRIFVERNCVGDGLAVDKWFSKVAGPRTAQDALDDLAENYAQAAVVDDVDLEAFRKTYPKTAAKLRVLKESEKLPAAVIAYQAGGVNEDALKKLRDGMIGAKKTERGRKLLDLCRISGFEAVPADYDQQLADSLKAYPPPTKK
jgi:ABC-type phosphate/phosphonate transport system substrate-binding protein